jgi:hypothetical protein
VVGEGTDRDQALDLFHYVYQVYQSENDDRNLENNNQEDSRALSRSSSFMDSLHDHTDSDDERNERTAASEFDRYFKHRDGSDCGKELNDVLHWWKV